MPNKPELNFTMHDVAALVGAPEVAVARIGFTAKEYAAEWGVSTKTARKYLAQGVEAGTMDVFQVSRMSPSGRQTVSHAYSPKGK